MEVNVGVIGLGYWGPNLVRNFNASPDSKVIICCDSQSDRCRKLAVQYPNFTYSQQVNDVINHPEVNAVAIATPVQSHYALAQQALLAGKHVLITKPITDNLIQARELVELADKMKLVLQVDHTFIYHPRLKSSKMS